MPAGRASAALWATRQNLRERFKGRGVAKNRAHSLNYLWLCPRLLSTISVHQTAAPRREGTADLSCRVGCRRSGRLRSCAALWNGAKVELRGSTWAEPFGVAPGSQSGRRFRIGRAALFATAVVFYVGVNRAVFRCVFRVSRRALSQVPTCVTREALLAPASMLVGIDRAVLGRFALHQGSFSGHSSGNFCR
jgi:hypothetical protein